LCQAALQKYAFKFYGDVRAGLTKCGDAIRKQIAKNAQAPGTGILVRAAQLCQAQLNKVLSKRQKFFEAIDATASRKCSSTHFQQLGHMLSGAPALQAPGTDFQDFLKNWLAVVNVKRALVEQIAEVPDFLNLLAAAINAPRYGTSLSGAPTDCSLPSTCDPRAVAGCRPDLCSLRVQCKSHACHLSATSSSVIDPAAGSAMTNSLVGQSIMDVCTLEGFGYGLGNSGDGVFLVGEPAQAVAPLTVMGNTICVDQISAEGFCACGGDFIGLSKDVSACQDHLVGAPNSDECPTGALASGGGVEAACFCGTNSTDVSMVPCGDGFPACEPGTVCGFTHTGAACHPGTRNGAVHVALSGATAAGDCVVYNSMRLTTLQPGGDCNPSQSGGINDNPASFGPDCTPCTSDDLAQPSDVRTIPFTTGTASAMIKDAVQSYGVCTATSNHACIEHANCANTTNTDDLCDGRQVIFPTFTTNAVSGAPVSSCRNLEDGTLTGLTLVGAAPLLDSPAIGDAVATFSLSCE
jgi:hypothetical protein